MYYRKGYAKLGLPTDRRLALLRNLATSLLENGKIITTVARAKALQPYVEKLLTKTKNDTPHNRKMLLKFLKSKKAYQNAFEFWAPFVRQRPGGYTRVVRCGLPRVGDGASLALIELVDRHASVEDDVPAAQEIVFEAEETSVDQGENS